MATSKTAESLPCILSHMSYFFRNLHLLPYSNVFRLLLQIVTSTARTLLLNTGIKYITLLSCYEFSMMTLMARLSSSFARRLCRSFVVCGGRFRAVLRIGIKPLFQL